MYQFLFTFLIEIQTWQKKQTKKYDSFKLYKRLRIKLETKKKPLTLTSAHTRVQNASDFKNQDK